jgi:predicted ArsR family transcriptional regulator
MLRSALTPAEKLAAMITSEGVTADGDIPMDYIALGARLGMAPRTVRYHMDAVRAAGWLCATPSIYQASTRRGRRPPHYRAKIPNLV